MSTPFTSELAWVDQQQERMLDRLQKWVSIHSGSLNRGGLARLAEELREALAVLEAPIETVELPPMRMLGADGELIDTPLGRALSLVKRPEAARRVLLVIHMDTVHPADREVAPPRLQGEKLWGPGVADAKGGLVVLLTALEALERSELADQLGWEVLINPDEELGSPGSAGLLEAAARRNDVGLVFEPTLPSGAMVSSRGGSGNFSVAVHGRAAHVGRAYHEGRSAVAAMAELVGRLEGVAAELSGVTVNVGRIDGGTAPNVVPELATSHFNVRYQEAGQEEAIQRRLEEVVATLDQREGLSAELHGELTAPVKPLDGGTQQLLEHAMACGQQLGLSMDHSSTGGVCDGNRLAAAGLATLDTLGVRGAGIHSHEEYMLVDSLAERAKLTALLLLRLASGELAWPERSRVEPDTLST